MECVFLDEEIAFRSKSIDAAATTLWRMFYERLHESEYRCDRAIWEYLIAANCFGVIAGSPDDGRYDEPPFSLGGSVTGLEELDVEDSDDMSYWECREEVDRGIDAFGDWVKKSVLKTWKSRAIQKLHKATDFAFGRFGIYTTPISGLHSSEIDEMDFLAGDPVPEPDENRRKPAKKRAKKSSAPSPRKRSKKAKRK